MRRSGSSSIPTSPRSPSPARPRSAARIAAVAAATIKRVTLELGGKSANVVFADADLEQAAAAAPGAVFGNAGQDCCARSRILVERSVLDRFLELLEAAVDAIDVGDPLDEETEMGPLISAGQRETVSSFVDDDAPVAFRGTAPDGPGFWFPPTVLCPVANDDRVAREEIFGPVACVIPFEGEAEAIRDRQRHALRALRLDLDPRRRQGAARLPRDRDRRALGQLEQLGAGLDPVRRLQAVGLRPRARHARARALHRGQERLLRDGRTDRRSDGMGRLDGQGLRDHRRRRRDRRRDGAAASPRRARRVVGVDRESGAEGDLAIVCDVTDEEQVSAMYRQRATSSAASTCSSTTPASSDRRRLRARHLGRGLAARPGREHAGRLPLLQARDPAPAGRGGGSVINTASFVAILGAATSQISYTASKGAVVALSRELGVEFARRGVRVNALCPGPVDTELLQELFASDRVQAERRLVHVPIGRFAEASEIANAALFLASDESCYVNASTFLVDGGITARLRHPGLAARTPRGSGRRARGRARSRRRSWARSRLGAHPGRGRSGSRRGRCGSRRSSAGRRRGRPRGGTARPRRGAEPERLQADRAAGEHDRAGGQRALVAVPLEGLEARGERAEQRVLGAVGVELDRNQPISGSRPAAARRRRLRRATGAEADAEQRHARPRAGRRSAELARRSTGCASSRRR